MYICLCYVARAGLGYKCFFPPFFFRKHDIKLHFYELFYNLFKMIEVYQLQLAIQKGFR